MNRHDNTQHDEQTIRPWTLEQAREAIPFMTSVLRSVREHWIDANAHEMRARRIDNRAGRPDRSSIIARTEAKSRCETAQGKLGDALEELHDIDVYCVNPIKGLAIIPFIRDGEPAWFTFDLFADEPLRGWRFHHDAMDRERPMSEVMEAKTVV